MPRIRTIKPEAFQHRKVGRLSHVSFRLWMGMIAHADDDGRIVADPAQLRVLVFGYHEMKVQQVDKALEEVAAVGLVRLYAVEGTRYADFPSWKDHQRIERPTPSKLPPYQHSENGHRGLTESSPKTPEGSEGIGRDQGSEGKGSDGERSLAEPPTSGIQFQIPASASEALRRAPVLGQVAKLRDPSWWQAQLRANPGVDFAAEILKAEAWIKTNPSRAPRNRYERFLHTWLARAERDG